VQGDSIEWNYNSGNGWGCNIAIPCNIPPLGDSATVDVRGYKYLCFEAMVETGTGVMISLSEYGTAAVTSEKYNGVNGSDGEAFLFDIQKGTGKWSLYRVDMTDLNLRDFWGNQQGNRICDLQSTSDLSFQVRGGQGKGVMKIKGLRFERN
jgi:hypothetical protein